jgi:DNA-binding beta-propeller fold protein YncE
MTVFRLFFYLSVLAGVFLVVSCVPSKKLGSNTGNSPEPLGLLLEKEIKGTILGQDLSRPYGVVSDGPGNLYFIDAGNNRVIWFNSDLEPVRDAGGFGSSDGLFNDPSYIASDKNLNVYISDAGNQRVTIFDSRLNYVDQINLIDDDDPLKFGRPSGLKVTEYGEIWIADYDRAQISILNNVWQYERSIGGVESTIGMLLNPCGMTDYSEKGTLVCDAGNSVVKVFDNIGILRDRIGYGDLEYPSGVTADQKNNIWVIDRDLSRLFCYGQSGKLIFSIGEYGKEGAYSFYQPLDITILPDNRLALSDSGNDRVLIYNILYP